MNTVSIRLLCAVLSVTGAAGLVAVSSPAVATGRTAHAPVAVAAAATPALAG